MCKKLYYYIRCALLKLNFILKIKVLTMKQITLIELYK